MFRVNFTVTMKVPISGYTTREETYEGEVEAEDAAEARSIVMDDWSDYTDECVNTDYSDEEWDVDDHGDTDLDGVEFNDAVEIEGRPRGGRASLCAKNRT